MASGTPLLPSLDCILLPLEAESPYDAIALLSEGLSESFSAGDAMRISAAAIARESLACTFIGHETAIPHARLGNIERFAFAVGIPAQALQWGPEHQPTRMVFLSVVPHSANTAYLQFMRQIALLVKDDEARLRVLESPTVEATRQWLTARLQLA